jgi:hypothetical protein
MKEYACFGQTARLTIPGLQALWLLCLLSGCITSEDQKVPGEGAGSFGQWVYQFEAPRGSVTRLVVARAEDQVRSSGYNRLGHGGHIGEHIKVNQHAYLCPPGALVLIDCRVEACVVVEEVPPEQLTRFYRAMRGPGAPQFRIGPELVRLGQELEDEKARRLIQKMVSDTPAGIEWRHAEGIDPVTKHPIESR